MTKILFSIATLAATLSVPALADPAARTLRFERDGISYVAQVRDTATGQIISGHERDSGRTFNLRVMNGRVSGNYAGATISYPANAAVSPLQTAAR